MNWGIGKNPGPIARNGTLSRPATSMASPSYLFFLIAWRTLVALPMACRPFLIPPLSSLHCPDLIGPVPVPVPVPMSTTVPACPRRPCVLRLLAFPPRPMVFFFVFSPWGDASQTNALLPPAFLLFFLLSTPHIIRRHSLVVTTPLSVPRRRCFFVLLSQWTAFFNSFLEEGKGKKSSQ